MTAANVPSASTTSISPTRETSLPQNMAAGAEPLAITIGWAITAVGMLALVFVYQSLATRKPDLDACPYAYAMAGFGPFIGFNSA